jgi:hypothetical protein
MSNGKLKSVAVAAVGALVLMMGVSSNDAYARERPAAAKKRPRANGTVTRTTEHQRTDTGRTRHDEWTGPNGNTATRDVVVVNDREAGTRSRDATITGPNGRTATHSTDWARTEDGRTRHDEWTGPNGNTATRDVEVTRDREAGVRTRESTAVGPNGGTASRTATTTCDKAAKSCTTTVETTRTPPVAPPVQPAPSN